MAGMPPSSPLTPALERAHSLIAAGDLAGAGLLLERAVEIGRANLGEDAPDVLAAQRALAVVYLREDDPMGARRVLEEAYAAGHLRLGDADPVMVLISHDLGVVAEELGNRHEARKAFGRVATHGPGVLGADHEAVARARAHFHDQDLSGVRGEAPSPKPRPEPVPQPRAEVGPLPPPPPVPLVPVRPTMPVAQVPAGAGDQKGDQAGPWDGPPSGWARQESDAPEPADESAADSARDDASAIETGAVAAGWDEERARGGNVAPGVFSVGTGEAPGVYPVTPNSLPAAAGMLSSYPQEMRPGRPPAQAEGGVVPPGDQLVRYPEQLAYPVPYQQGSRGRRGLAVAAVAAALVAAFVAVAALMFVLVKQASEPAAVNTGTVGPTAGNGPELRGDPPSGIALDVDGSSVEVSWRDPAEGRVSFIVTMARSGEQLRPVATIGPGETSYRVSGLNSTMEYCFAVVAVYGTDRFASSPQACTDAVSARPSQ